MKCFKFFLKHISKYVLREEFSALHEELAEYKRKAHYDALTGCLSPNGMDEQLANINDDRRRSNGRTHSDFMVIMMLDLDKFKDVNDAFGHETGDRVILIAAQSIQACCRKGDVVGRRGGDEFVIILSSGGDHISTHTKQYAENRAMEIRLSIEERLKDFSVTASIGFTIARTTGDRRRFDSYVNQADMAMYQAKNNGGNCAVFAPIKKTLSLIGNRGDNLASGVFEA